MAQLLASIFYNIDTLKISNSVGLSKSILAIPAITLKQKDLILNVDFIHTGGAPVTGVFALSDTWNYAGDDDFDPGSTNMLLSDDSQFNIASDRPDLDVVNGKICVRINGDSLDLQAAFAALSNPEKLPVFFGEIQVFAPPAINPKGIFKFDQVARNLVNNAGAGPAPAPAIDFYTIGQIDSLLGGKEDLRKRFTAGVDATVGAVSDIQTTPLLRARIVQNFYIRTTAITGAAGMPTIRIKTDGGAILAGPTAMLATEGVVPGLMRMSTGHRRMILPGEKTQIEITDPGTSTTHVLTVYDDGIEVDE